MSSIEILMSTESKEGLLVWRDGFGLAIKGGKVGELTIAFTVDIYVHVEFDFDFGSKEFTSVLNLLHLTSFSRLP